MKSSPIASGVLRSVFATLCLMVGAGATVTVSAQPALAEAVAAPANATFSLRLPKVESVEYRGVVSFDQAGAPSAQILYPAPGIAGFIAAIATHGVIMDVVKTKEKERLQLEADKVMAPFKPLLATFSHRDLMSTGLPLLQMPSPMSVIEDTGQAATASVISSAPVFYMTQDQAALVLINTLAVHRSGQPAEPSYQNVVKVVSDPRAEEDLPKAWAADDGKLLKEESARLFALSLRALLDDVGRKASTPDSSKTFRFQEGQARKVERAHLIEAACGRAVVKTLRGWLMSIPQPAQNGTDEKCP